MKRRSRFVLSMLAACLVVVGMSAAATANGDSFPPITPDNVSQLALAARFDGDNLPVSEKSVSSFAFSPDSAHLAVAQANAITLISTESLAIEQTFGADDSPAKRIFHLSYSPDGRYLSSYDGRIFDLWDAEQGQHLFAGRVMVKGDGVSIDAIQFDRLDPNQLLVFTSWSNELHGYFASLWDIAAQREMDRISYRRCEETDFSHSPLCRVFDYYHDERWMRRMADRMPLPDTPCAYPFHENITFDPTQEQFSVIQSCHRGEDERDYFYGRYVADTLERLALYPLDARYPVAAISPDGSLLFYHDDGDRWFYDPATQERFDVIPMLGWKAEAQFNPNGNVFGIRNGRGILHLYAVFACAASSDREVNLRAEPSTDATIGAVLAPGERVGVYARETVDGFTWLRVMNGLWVRGDVVQLSGCAAP